MSGAYTAERVAAVLDEHGDTMTLKRAGETDLAVKGKRVGGTLVDAGNTATQEEFQIRLSKTQLLASSWATKEPSADSDSIVVDSRLRTILDAQPRGDAGVVAFYLLTVAG
jgi:hypothetical protein